MLADAACQQKIRRLEKRRWIIWIPLALAFLTVYFHRIAPGVVTDQLMRDFGITRAAQMGALSSIYFYTYALVQIPAGIMADYWGPRRTVACALLVSAIGAVSFGLSNSLFGLYAGRFFSSLGSGLIYVSIMKIHAEWFRGREFGTMSGLIVFVGNIGAILAATPLAFLIENLGWRPSFFILFGYTISIAAVCWLIIRDRPTDAGLPSIAEIEAYEGTPRSPDTQDTISIINGVRKILGNRYTWAPFYSSVAVYGVYMAFIGIWGVPYFTEVYGMTRTEAASLVMAATIGNMVGGPLAGYLSDRLRLRRLPYICLTVIFLMAWLVLIICNGTKCPEWALYLICFAIGIGVSGNPLTIACVKEVNNPRTTGIAAGIANSGAFIGASIMQPAFGWILDKNWGGVMEQGVKIYSSAAYASAFWFCAIVLISGVVSTFMIQETKCSNIGTK